MAAPRKYSVELQARATRMALDARKDPQSARGAIKRVADQLGVHPEALRNWVRQAEIDGGVRPGTTTEDAQGEVTDVSDPGPLGLDQIVAAAATLTGDIMQVPSSVSAIKVDGKRAYDRVRAGESVELKARPATERAYEKGKQVNTTPTVNETSRSVLFGQTAANVKA